MTLVYIAHRNIHVKNIHAKHMPYQVPAAALVWAARSTMSSAPQRQDARTQRRCACAVAALEVLGNAKLQPPTNRKPYELTLDILQRAVARASFPGGLQSIEQFAAESPGLTQRLSRPTVRTVGDAWLKVNDRTDALDARDATRGFAARRDGPASTHILQRMHEVLHAAVHLRAARELVRAASDGVMDAEEALVLGAPYTPQQRARRRDVLLAHHASHTSSRVLRKFTAAAEQ